LNLSSIADLFGSLLHTIAMRPYVVAFLAAFLVIGFVNRGLQRTLSLLVVGTAIAFVSEWFSVHVGFPFGTYHYLPDAIRGAWVVGDIPLWSPVSFAFIAYAAYETAEWLGWRSKVVGPALLMTLADLLIDPIAVRGDQWFLGHVFDYGTPGVYWGVPVSNFVGWFVVGCLIQWARHLAWRNIRAPAPLRQVWLGPGLYYGILAFVSSVGVWIGEPWIVIVGWLPQFAVVAAAKRTRRKKSDRRQNPVGVIAVGLILLASGGVTHAQSVDASDELLNWAFANRLGSGVYHVSGRTVWILRVPVRFTVRDTEERPWGLVLKFPVTFGFYDFKPSDIIEHGLPDRVGTLTFVPGVEFRLPVRPNWMLMPIAEAGVGKDFQGGETVGIFAVALKSRVTFASDRWDFLVGNEVAYSKQTKSVESPADDFASFEAGFEAKHSLGVEWRGNELDYGLFTNTFFYFDSLEFLLPDGNSVKVNAEYEVGFTFGSRTPTKLWGIKMPRLGLSWRRSNELGAIRLIIGNAF